eukprot:CAMPEP_0115482766 /NCGR_PEP_ID=MMETSP0271-20121206/58501_1 /TAXON_ID=71861 /ORGANISM="Scrippsiella trochoidea, Strain CCMP3099" /LENGTH=186 /DNA_ID=CAMNT_0002910579 /DNA_START=20 /DNA_END=580 /DNA_ORIENTATION=+
MGCATSSGRVAAGQLQEGSLAAPPTCIMSCSEPPEPSPASLHPSAGEEGCDGTQAAIDSAGCTPAATAVALAAKEKEPPTLLGNRSDSVDRSPSIIPDIGACGLLVYTSDIQGRLIKFDEQRGGQNARRHSLSIPVHAHVVLRWQGHTGTAVAVGRPGGHKATARCVPTDAVEVSFCRFLTSHIFE